MGVAIASPFVVKIGETAGDVWQHLLAHGPNSLTKLAIDLNQPRDLIMLAVGWLAREDKVEITEEGRKRTVSLK